MNNVSNDTEKYIDSLISELTLDEKIGMIHGAGLFCTKGVERLGIPAMKFSDGPMGVRHEMLNDKWMPVGLTDDYVSYMPSNSAIASTWNETIAYEAGQVLGAEARGRGKDMILAPGVNIKRSPLCGRNFEYLSEDPLLTSRMTVNIIKGIQENDVSACVKHFAVNSQENNRLHVDTYVDEKALNEIYYPAFRAAVEEAGTYSVMGAYNKINGDYCCENKELMDDLLRDEWGFDGTVVSDWGAVHNTVPAAKVSMDIEMSIFGNFDDYCFARPLKAAVESGEVSIDDIDKKIKNILRMMYRLKMIGEHKNERKSGAYNTESHRRSILRAARESVILLKNNNHALPLDKESLRGKRVALIGCNANAIHSSGGGSAEIKALYEISPLMGIKKYLGGNTEVVYAPGYYIPPRKSFSDFNWQAGSVPDESEVHEIYRAIQEDATRIKLESYESPITDDDRRLHDEAVALAQSCDEVIFIGGLSHDYDVEGEDRPYMHLPYHQSELIDRLLTVRPDMKIVMIAGSPVMMPWADRAPAIVWSYYAGMETGTALAEVLFGNINPCGRLAETMPVTYEDTPTGQNKQFGTDGPITHEESVFVGYRHYEKNNITPLYCFGHGLSYTEYEYGDLKIENASAHNPESLDTMCGKSVSDASNGTNTSDNIKIKISLSVKNTGSRSGKETVQLYVAGPDNDESASISASDDMLSVNAGNRVKQLKAFKKVTLEPGETKTVTITLDNKAFESYDTDMHDFRVIPGAYRIYVGASCEDIRLTGEVTI